MSFNSQIPVQMPQPLRQHTALMGRCRGQLHQAHELSAFQQISDTPGCILPGDLLGCAHSQHPFACRDTDARIIIPRAVGPAVQHEAVAAMVEAAHTKRKLFRGQASGERRRKDHPVIGAVAPYAEELVHHLLGHRKSEGRLCALRFHGINDLNLFCFAGDEEAHLLRQRRMARQS